MSANDPVNKPSHYTHVKGVECKDVAKHFSYFRGNAIKYIWRAGHKGDEIEDLRKAIRSLEEEIRYVQESRGLDKDSGADHRGDDDSERGTPPMAGRPNAPVTYATFDNLGRRITAPRSNAKGWKPGYPRVSMGKIMDGARVGCYVWSEYHGKWLDTTEFHE